MRPIATTRSAAGMPTGKLAIWWVIVSEIVIFGGVLMSYIMHRIGHPEYGDAAAHTNTWIGAINTLVLLSSSLSAVLAHAAAERGDGKLAARRLLYTIAGALTFLCIKSYEWYTEISHGFTITQNGEHGSYGAGFWSFYYIAAGIHAGHVLAGAIIMGIIAWGAYRGKELQRVELIGIYWHFVDVVWVFLFPLLYIAK
jgi:heme/copper-type cytochrome/quinol oxidase subunit 3